MSWFEKDVTRQSLKSITMTHGQIRGLSDLKIHFSYPVSAIAGKNGSGKSTVLALAACAFHNHHLGWKLPDRRLPYYTFSDFFIQAAEDVAVGGVAIRYGILHNGWKVTDTLPQGEGLGYQIRKKKHNGKWNDYDKRVRRCVAYLGIERVVPPAERSVYKSYRYSFSSSSRIGWEEQVRESVSRVLGVAYDDFEIKSHGKYRLPLVKRKGRNYSGFNMGAGEKALFEVFAAIFAAPNGALFLIDELELGLHESAQRRLVRELSRICFDRKIQVICTTHSPVILASLPPEGRFLIHSGDVTQVLTEVSAAYAAGRLGEVNSNELTVYVEDEVAAILVDVALGYGLLQRVRITPIGSHTAVVQQMAARYLDDSNSKCVAILDGDQASAFQAHLKKFDGYVGGNRGINAKKWIENKLLLLPDKEPPETWVFARLKDLNDDQLLLGFSGIEVEVLRDAIDRALLADTHSQIFEFSKVTGVGIKYIWRDCCRALLGRQPKLLESIVNSIKTMLKD